jgi:recombination protein RecT
MSENNQLNIRQTTRQETIQTVRVLLESQKSRVAALLPKHITPERIFMITRTALSASPRLAECNAMSICGAVMQASMIGLEPNTPLGHCYLIPFWNKKANAGRGGYEAQLILGAAGKIQLLIQSGYVLGCTAKIVRKNDDFEFDDGLHPTLRHRYHNIEDRGPVIGYWGGCTLRGNFDQYAWATVADIEQHRDRFALAKGRDGKIVGPWKDHFDQMALKTMIHRVSKHAPKSTVALRAFALDAAAERGALQQFDPVVPPEMWQTGAMDDPVTLDAVEEVDGFAEEGQQ